MDRFLLLMEWSILETGLYVNSGPTTTSGVPKIARKRLRELSTTVSSLCNRLEKADKNNPNLFHYSDFKNRGLLDNHHIKINHYILYAFLCFHTHAYLTNNANQLYCQFRIYKDVKHERFYKGYEGLI